MPLVPGQAKARFRPGGCVLIHLLVLHRLRGAQRNRDRERLPMCRSKRQLVWCLLISSPSRWTLALPGALPAMALGLAVLQGALSWRACTHTCTLMPSYTPGDPLRPLHPHQRAHVYMLVNILLYTKAYTKYILKHPYIHGLRLSLNLTHTCSHL